MEWNQKEINELILFRKHGLSFSKIACKMGTSKNTIAGKIFRLGLCEPKIIKPKIQKPRILKQKIQKHKVIIPSIKYYRKPKIEKEKIKPLTRKQKEEIEKDRKIRRQEKMLYTGGRLPLPAGHSISWGAISNTGWKIR